MKPSILALTPGEPAGIGLDLAIMIAQQQHAYCLVAIVDPGALQERANLLGLALDIKEFDGSISNPGELQIVPVTGLKHVNPGQLDNKNAAYVLETLEIATQGCLTGQFDALVTGPIQKSIINDAGIRFSGHTEFLAEKTGAELPVMMLANEMLRVALVTTHLPLSDVAKTITHEKVELVTRITHSDLIQKFGIPNPKIAICGLNPHAGESGHLGTEEIEIITPIVDQLKAQGFDLIGPLPADTAFTPNILDQVDTVIAMYHDQGLPVVKALGFGKTVNITLGLPIIRTSVDHGTALSLAATGQIETTSLMTALAMADDMVQQQAQ